MSDMKDLDPLHKWPEKRKRLKRKYPDLTDNDLSYEVGEEDRLFGRIGKRLGKNRKETRNIIRDI
ncbi:MAG TPA: hypothetical protein VK112_10450 [Fodinibius sp.]|nr:hypothetical protein [Fodinibius sp.]